MLVIDSAMVQGTIDNVAQLNLREIIVQSCDAIKIHELLGEIEGAAHVLILLMVEIHGLVEKEFKFSKIPLPLFHLFQGAQW